MFGHAWVLGREWKGFVDRYWSEHQIAVSESITMRVPLLLQDSMQGWGVVAYAPRGYTTFDAVDRTVDNDFVIERRWSGPIPARMLQLADQEQIYDPDAIERLRLYLRAILWSSPRFRRPSNSCFGWRRTLSTRLVR